MEEEASGAVWLHRRRAGVLEKQRDWLPTRSLRGRGRSGRRPVGSRRPSDRDRVDPGGWLAGRSSKEGSFRGGFPSGGVDDGTERDLHLLLEDWNPTPTTRGWLRNLRSWWNSNRDDVWRDAVFHPRPLVLDARSSLSTKPSHPQQGDAATERTVTKLWHAPNTFYQFCVNQNLAQTFISMPKFWQQNNLAFQVRAATENRGRLMRLQNKIELLPHPSCATA
jgi:hypothetical protein